MNTKDISYKCGDKTLTGYLADGSKEKKAPGILVCHQGGGLRDHEKERARKLGTRLVVALNTDASVKRLGKGPERPINPLADRLEVIAALESVDYVTWFGEDTPRELIQLLLPDVLVKGGDWKPAQIAGSDLVLARKGQVRSLPFVAGRSTTQMLKKARQ